MNFTISALERNTDDGVVVAHWRVSKTLGDNIATSYGTVNFTPDSSIKGYTAYDSLTEESVIKWVQASLDIELLEASLDADLAEQASPSIIKGTPW